MCIYIQDPTSQKGAGPQMDELIPRSTEPQAAAPQNTDDRKDPYDTFLQSLSDDITGYLSNQQTKKQPAAAHSPSHVAHKRISKKRPDKAPKDPRKRVKPSDNRP